MSLIVGGASQVSVGDALSVGGALSMGDALTRYHVPHSWGERPNKSYPAVVRRMALPGGQQPQVATLPTWLYSPTLWAQGMEQPLPPLVRWACRLAF